ncbi:LacI family DNA-binding transcriptional regulator [Microlunatus sp. GCM10028923]|uniref:LacI family DNA-binding transcriptional regulator n=1 Tax=Microlunatus sp. GCM10028923 TaxID=3273400 RepID=UPI003608AB86
MPNVTIQDVARRAGVSKGLVSLALNNRPGVAAATRQRVLDTAAELGWIPNQYARGLSLRTTFTLGLVVRRDPSVLMANPFFASFITGVESVLSTRGWSLLLSVVPDEDAERDAYRNLAGNRADGFFLTDLRIDDPRPGLLAELGAEAVLVGPPQPGTDLPAVNLDDRPGVTASVDHLVQLGHRRIAHVTGDVRLVHGAGRLDAFRRAMERAGLAPDLVRPGDFSAASGAAATAALLSGPDRPTAIVYGSDSMAVAGLKVLQSEGVRVPEDVSIVGFEGIELGEYLNPPLTTVRTEPVRWGVEAATLLCARLAGEPNPDQPDLPPAELLVRDSTAAPPSTGDPV